MRRSTDDEERAADERRLHYEIWRWGGRPPSETLLAVQGSNVLGLLEYDADLVHALDALAPDVQRSVALLAAHRACETAGLTAVPWVAGALTALTRGRPLPPPFDDTNRMWEILHSTELPPGPPVRRATPPERTPYFPPTPAGWTWIPIGEPDDDGARHYTLGRLPESARPAVSDGKLSAASAADVNVPAAAVTFMELTHSARRRHDFGPISQSHFALPAVLAAAEASPLHAALDAVSHAIATFGEHYPALLEEIRSFCAAQRPVRAERSAAAAPSDQGEDSPPRRHE
ncbi:hypothetical protein ACWENA_21550 [Streptomyces sp. NPDC004779]